MDRRRFVACLSALATYFGILRPTRTIGQEQASQDSPSSVAKASFEALKGNQLEKFVELFHPDALKQFKGFVSDVFKDDQGDKEVEQIKALFVPLSTPEAIDAASSPELLKIFLANSLKKIPGWDAAIADAQLQILGEIPESPDLVHVVSRTVSPRPSAVSCKKWDGKWFQLLNDEQVRLISGFVRLKHFRAKNLKPAEILQKLQKITLDSVDVVGHVADGENTAQVLCRVESHVDDFKMTILGCYPVRRGEPAWDLLSSNDEARLVEALRAKWRN